MALPSEWGRAYVARWSARNEWFYPYMPSILFVGQMQTVQTQIRRPERGVWSGTPLCAYIMFSQNLNKMKSTTTRTFKIEKDWSNWKGWENTFRFNSAEFASFSTACLWRVTNYFGVSRDSKTGNIDCILPVYESLAPGKGIIGAKHQSHLNGSTLILEEPDRHITKPCAGPESFVRGVQLWQRVF